MAYRCNGNSWDCDECHVTGLCDKHVVCDECATECYEEYYNIEDTHLCRECMESNYKMSISE